MKFGGTSLEDALAFERVAHIVGSSVNSNLVVVASAMSGVTDALISGYQRAAKGETSKTIQTIEHHFERHLYVTNILGSAAREKMRAIIENSRREIIELLHAATAGRNVSAAEQDAMASHDCARGIRNTCFLCRRTSLHSD
jgi:aspartokinase